MLATDEAALFKGGRRVAWSGKERSNDKFARIEGRTRTSAYMAAAVPTTI
jgi:hypothetical protein